MQTNQPLAANRIVFDELVESLRSSDTPRVEWVAPPEKYKVDAQGVKSIRAVTGLSQPGFAKILNVDVGTLRSWEQGRREPTGSAKALLKAIKHDPQSVLRALVA